MRARARKTLRFHNIIFALLNDASASQYHTRFGICLGLRCSFASLLVMDAWPEWYCQIAIDGMINSLGKLDFEISRFRDCRGDAEACGGILKEGQRFFSQFRGRNAKETRGNSMVACTHLCCVVIAAPSRKTSSL